MATELYREIPCEVCGLKPWESVYAFRSPGIAHLMPSDDFKKLGDPCLGSGGSREEVTIDYEASARYAVKLFIGERAAEKPIPPHIQTGVQRIVDIALGETG